MGNTKLKYNKKLNRKVKIYYENIKGNDGKIVNHKKLSKKNIYRSIPLPWFGYLPYLSSHK